MKRLSLHTRRPSIVSLPAVTLLHRRDEDAGSPVPYANGPVQVIPGIWIGSEDNARDWKALVERGIRSILNVAKEVSSPFDEFPLAQGLRSAVSTPNFRTTTTTTTTTTQPTSDADPVLYYPPHVPSGRPAIHYLKLDWSHGQQDLVNHGFKEAMAFVDAALNRADACLIHCQCGISRSATMVIALVMRAAAERHSYVPPEVWALSGMQAAYDYVKLKSPCVGPNMSLIYSLLEYEKTLRKPTDDASSSSHDSDASSVADDEQEWTRRRRLLDDEADPFVTSPESQTKASLVVLQEANALDKAMQERIVARKSSASSISYIGSGSGSVFSVDSGTNTTWRSRRHVRKRAPSVLSTRTTGSVSEDLVEEDEEGDLLGIGGGFDNDTTSSSHQTEEESSPDDADVDVVDHRGTPRNGSALAFSLWKSPPPPRTATSSRSSSASRSTASISSMSISTYAYPAPVTAIRSTFDLSPTPSPPPSLTKPKAKRRPASLSLSLSGLPPVPASPIALVTENGNESGVGATTAGIAAVNGKLRETTSTLSTLTTSKSIPRVLIPTPIPTPVRKPSESRVARPSSLRQSLLSSSSSSLSSSSSISSINNNKSRLRRSSESKPSSGLMTPSQTLFVFPPSPTTATSGTPSTATMSNGSRTPSTMTLFSNPTVPPSFSGIQTPRVSSFGAGYGIGILGVDACGPSGGGSNIDGVSGNTGDVTTIDNINSSGTTATASTSKAARRRSWILTSTPAALPTVGLAKVDARGYFGFEVPS